MTPKHICEVNALKTKFLRIKKQSHIRQCKGCQDRIAALRALHKARVAQQTQNAATSVENPGGLTVVAFKKKPHLDATPHMPSASGNNKVH